MHKDFRICYVHLCYTYRSSIAQQKTFKFNHQGTTELLSEHKQVERMRGVRKIFPLVAKSLNYIITKNNHFTAILWYTTSWITWIRNQYKICLHHERVQYCYVSFVLPSLQKLQSIYPPLYCRSDKKWLVISRSRLCWGWIWTGFYCIYLYVQISTNSFLDSGDLNMNMKVNPQLCFPKV